VLIPENTVTTSKNKNKNKKNNNMPQSILPKRKGTAMSNKLRNVTRSEWYWPGVPNDFEEENADDNKNHSNNSFASKRKALDVDQTFTFDNITTTGDGNDNHGDTGNEDGKDSVTDTNNSSSIENNTTEHVVDDTNNHLPQEPQIHHHKQQQQPRKFQPRSRRKRQKVSSAENFDQDRAMKSLKALNKLDSMRTTTDEHGGASNSGTAAVPAAAAAAAENHDHNMQRHDEQSKETPTTTVDDPVTTETQPRGTRNEGRSAMMDYVPTSAMTLLVSKILQSQIPELNQVVSGIRDSLLKMVTPNYQVQNGNNTKDVDRQSSSNFKDTKQSATTTATTKVNDLLQKNQELLERLNSTMEVEDMKRKEFWYNIKGTQERNVKLETALSESNRLNGRLTDLLKKKDEELKALRDDHNASTASLQSRCDEQARRLNRQDKIISLREEELIKLRAEISALQESARKEKRNDENSSDKRIIAMDTNKSNDSFVKAAFKAVRNESTTRRLNGRISFASASGRRGGDRDDCSRSLASVFTVSGSNDSNGRPPTKSYLSRQLQKPSASNGTTTAATAKPTFTITVPGPPAEQSSTSLPPSILIDSP
jgi:hypothetical protein